MTRILMAIAVLLVAYMALSPVPETKTVQVPVTVRSGDTLDGIIYKLANEYGDQRDYREIRYYTRKLNNLQDKKYIYAGDNIVIELKVAK